MSGLLTLGDDPAPEAVESAMRQLASSLNGDADLARREAVRAQAVAIVKKYGWRAQTVDTLLAPPSSAAREDTLQGRALMLSTPEPWHEPVNGADVLDDLVRTYSRFLALPRGAPTLLALWTIHSHAHDAAAVSPLLSITSAAKRCAKTTTMNLIGALVPRPLSVSNITTAAMFRAIEMYRPTLLVDEADTFLRDNDELRGILNSGHTRAGAQVVRTVGDDHETRIFATWAPKAIALIGELRDTLRDRSIELRMRRRRPDEHVERLRLDRLHEHEPLRRRCARWTADHMDALRDADPDVPSELHDRAADNWRTLLAIADLAAGRWPDRARRAARLLCGVQGDDDGDVRALLLSDLRRLFKERDTDKLFSEDIVSALVQMEDRPWPEWRDGKPLTQRQLAVLLKPFEVKPKKVRIGEKAQQGYEIAALEDSFARYLPADPEQPEHSYSPNGNPPFSIRNTTPGVPDRESGGNRWGTRDVPVVPDPEPPLGLWGDVADYDRLERAAIQRESEPEGDR